jgi:hypothetical protein
MACPVNVQLQYCKDLLNSSSDKDLLDGSVVINTAFRKLFTLVYRKLEIDSLIPEYLNFVKSSLDSELLHCEHFSYFSSFGRSPSFERSAGRLHVYLTQYNLNIKSHRKPAKVFTNEQVARYTFKSLLKFAITAFSSVCNNIHVSTSANIRHVLAVDTIASINSSLAFIFQDIEHISLLEFDHSEFYNAGDQHGIKPESFVKSVRKHLSSLGSFHSCFSTNLDYDDLISPLHSELCAKYVMLANINSRSNYLCFPYGLQFSAVNKSFYSYVACSNCFMTVISDMQRVDFPLIWSTNHDKPNPNMNYSNVLTWNPVWCQFIWGKNVANSIWPSSLRCADDVSESHLGMLFKISPELINVLND